MRIWAVIGAVVSLLAGTPAGAVEEAGAGPSARESDGSAEGYAVAGEAFLVWDEDRRSAEQWGAELAGAIPQKHED